MEPGLKIGESIPDGTPVPQVGRSLAVYPRLAQVEDRHEDVLGSLAFSQELRSESGRVGACPHGLAFHADSFFEMKGLVRRANSVFFHGFLHLGTAAAPVQAVTVLIDDCPDDRENICW